MKKTLQIEIDLASWSNSPPKYRKTCPFASNQTLARVDFLRAMLWIGVTSIPIQIPRWWLASQWAVLRYVAAADQSTRRLRLHTAIDDLESHHKTVLSDDWGVGLSLQWLAARMRYKHLVHGAFAMQALRDGGVAQFVKRKKRGPFKCPDFFAVDRQDKIHLIECKGNQKGPSHLDRQFQRGRQQKQNVRFQNEGLVAQRVLAGVAIAGQSSSWLSTLKIADPSPTEERSYYNIISKTHLPIIRAFKKILIVQGLIAAGGARIANRWFPSETSIEDERILSEIPTTQFDARGERWEGLVYELTFPVGLGLDDGSSITGCRMRFGASIELLAKLTTDQGTRGSQEKVIDEMELDITEERELETDDESSTLPKERTSRHATIKQGKAFLADLELLEA
ncbi:MAG TPA: hypothetical protein VFN26_19970 [Candidatus Acidoferrum sp.]|nr:hypothetical protein [Candidatus Acidoferrum sp.]